MREMGSLMAETRRLNRRILTGTAVGAALVGSMLPRTIVEAAVWDRNAFLGPVCSGYVPVAGQINWAKYYVGPSQGNCSRNLTTSGADGDLSDDTFLYGYQVAGASYVNPNVSGNDYLRWYTGTGCTGPNQIIYNGFETGATRLSYKYNGAGPC